jgi:hypothetical protein
MHHNKTTLYRLPVYTAIRKYPAEYFCQRAYKKLALAPLYLKGKYYPGQSIHINKTCTAKHNLANFLVRPWGLANDLW